MRKSTPTESDKARTGRPKGAGRTPGKAPAVYNEDAELVRSLDGLTPQEAERAIEEAMNESTTKLAMMRAQLAEKKRAMAEAEILAPNAAKKSRGPGIPEVGPAIVSGLYLPPMSSPSSYIPPQNSTPKRWVTPLIRPDTQGGQPRLPPPPPPLLSSSFQSSPPMSFMSSEGMDFHYRPEEPIGIHDVRIHVGNVMRGFMLQNNGFMGLEVRPVRQFHCSLTVLTL